MKKAIYVFFSVLICAVSLQAQSWSKVLEPDIKANLNDLVLISDSELWAVGDDGLVLHTTDGFESFDKVSIGTDADLAKVYFFDGTTGWIGAESGSVFYTTDGGTNWSETSFSSLMPASFSFSYFDGLYFVDDTLGFALAGKSKLNYLYKTTDGGVSWAIKDSLNTGSSERWYDIEFYDENNGVVGGSDYGDQRYTIDGGETWAVGDSDVYSPFGGCELEWLNNTDVIYVGQGLEYWGLTLTIFKSTDGGKTWEDKSTAAAGIYDRATGMYFKDANNGIVVGNNGFRKMFIMKTSDGGSTWTSSMGDYSLGFTEVAGNGDLLYALATSGHILKSEDFGATWEILYFNTTTSIVSMQFVGDKGYMINGYSDFLASSDGIEWNNLASVGLWDAGAIYFLDESTGFAVKENAGILKTTDGGESWKYVLEPVDYASTNKVGGISFGTDQIGYVWFSISAYADYRIYKTTDAGESWSEVSQIEGPGYLSGGIEFFDANDGFIAGPRVKPDTVYFSWLQYTEDGGASWKDADLSAVPDEYKGQSFYSVAKVDENTAFAVGGASLLKTVDKGKTWSYVNCNVTLNDTSFYRIDFNGDYGILATSDCEILLTEDGGSTWELNQEFYDAYIPYAVAVSDEGKAFFGTNDGNVYAYYDPTGVEDNDEALVKDYSLSQNYPNPFNPTTNIKFSIPEAGMVSVAVYNIIGQKVLDVTNQFYQAGSHQLKIDGSNLSSGVYFYQLTAGSYQLTKKMMLLK